MAGGRLPFVGAGEGGGNSFYEGEGAAVPMVEPGNVCQRDLDMHKT